MSKESGKKAKKEFGLKDIEKKAQFDLSQVVDLYDEDGMLEEIDAENLVIQHDEEERKEKKKEKNQVKK